MMRFTDSPYEALMRRNRGPTPDSPRLEALPEGHPCRGCAFRTGGPCVGNCYKKLLKGEHGNGV